MIENTHCLYFRDSLKREKYKQNKKIVENNNPEYLTSRPRCRSEALVSDPQQSLEDIFLVYLKLWIINISAIDIGN